MTDFEFDDEKFYLPSGDSFVEAKQSDFDPLKRYRQEGRVFYEMDAEEEEDHIERTKPIPTPIPTRLSRIMEKATGDLYGAIEADLIAPPVGLFATIASVSLKLNEVARIVPPKSYIQEAEALIKDLGVLPELMEPIRQLMLKLLSNPDQPEDEDYPKPKP